MSLDVAETMAMLQDCVGQRVRWHQSNPAGWAGSGVGTITAFSPARPFFAPPVGSGNPGPAFELELEHNKARVWAAPDECDLLTHEVSE